VTSWETCDAPLDEQQRRDFVLKQPSIVGPWVVFGLALTLLAFLGSLLYVNLLKPPGMPSAAERLARSDTETTVHTPTRSKRHAPRVLERRKPAITRVPQGRAPNALLGGQGPASPSEYGGRPGTAVPWPMPPQPAAGRY